MLTGSLHQVQWEPLYALQSCEEQYQYFYVTLDTLLNSHFRTLPVTFKEPEKPWVTDGFRELVKRRNMAWKSGNDYISIYKTVK